MLTLDFDVKQRIKHYLFTGLKIQSQFGGGDFDYTGRVHTLSLMMFEDMDFEKWKPILRPLTAHELNKFFDSKKWEKDIDVRTYFLQGFFENRGFDSLTHLLEHSVGWWPVGLFNLFINYHFDVFGLIDTGQAIDMNTLSYLK